MGDVIREINLMIREKEKFKDVAELKYNFEEEEYYYAQIAVLRELKQRIENGE